MFSNNSSSPVHFFSFLDDLLAIAVGSSALLLRLLRGGRLVLLNLVILVGLLHAHLAAGGRTAQTEIRVINHIDGQLHRFGAQVDCDLE
jgi:hypothetical protein